MYYAAYFTPWILDLRKWMLRMSMKPPFMGYDWYTIVRYDAFILILSMQLTGFQE